MESNCGEISNGNKQEKPNIRSTQQLAKYKQNKNPTTAFNKRSTSIYKLNKIKEYTTTTLGKT